ncbi:MAG: hypothetical protein K0B16_09600, partial [Burkholderiaceae bacterium]|nr:hypothetical protein [Burkholderiaceae bacterium]
MRNRLSSLLSALVTASLMASNATAAPNLPTRTSSAAAVMISATPHPFTGTVWEFDVALNTHSAALSDDLAKSASLVADGGKSFAPLAWQGDAPGGHHRKGVLQFKPISPLPKSLELRITRE